MKFLEHIKLAAFTGLLLGAAHGTIDIIIRIAVLSFEWFEFYQSLLIPLVAYTIGFIALSLFIELIGRFVRITNKTLNVFYLIMAVYGWYEWKYGGNNHHGIQIHRLGLKKNCLVILTVLILTLISGTLLTNNTQAAWPYVDSFTTWGSVVTTIMVTRKILDNWLYWFVIDGISIPLYLERELYLTALLFVLYLVIVVFGYFNWSKQFSQEILSNESEVSNHA